MCSFPLRWNRDHRQTTNQPRPPQLAKQGNEATWNEAGEHENAIFYRKIDDEEAFDKDEQLKESLFLKWKGDINEAVRALRKQGLTVGWNGSPPDCLIIPPDHVIMEMYPEVSELSEIKEHIIAQTNFLMESNALYNQLSEVLKEEPSMSTILSSMSRLHHEIKMAFIRDEEIEELEFVEEKAFEIAARNMEMEAPHHVCDNCAEKEEQKTRRYIG